MSLTVPIADQVADIKRRMEEIQKEEGRDKPKDPSQDTRYDDHNAYLEHYYGF